MGYLDMYTLLERHADRISRGDEDLKQDLLSLSYTTFSAALSRGYELSLGELVNFMQLRAKELRSGKRRHFGNVGQNGPKDVYSKVRYYNDDVKVLHLDGAEGLNDVLMDSYHKRTTPIADKIAFRIDFRKFLMSLPERDRLILAKRMEGYKLRELSSIFNSSPSGISKCLKRVGEEIAVSLDIPRDLAISYGLV